MFKTEYGFVLVFLVLAVKNKTTAYRTSIQICIYLFRIKS